MVVNLNLTFYFTDMDRYNHRLDQHITLLSALLKLNESTGFVFGESRAGLTIQQLDITIIFAKDRSQH